MDQKCYCCGKEARVGLLVGEDSSPFPLCLDCFAAHVKGNTQIINGLIYYKEFQRAG